jgi:hypothetical protein
MATPPRRKTAPTGVIVASKSRDFSRPDANPKALQNRTDGRDHLHTTAERLAADVTGAEEGADHRLVVAELGGPAGALAPPYGMAQQGKFYACKAKSSMIWAKFDVWPPLIKDYHVLAPPNSQSCLRPFRPPRPPSGTERWDPARRFLAD